MNETLVNFVSRSGSAASTLLALEGALDQINVLWAGSPNYQAQIDQAGLDSVTSFSGLTVQELTDAEFALATVLNTIKNALPALTVLGTLP